MKCENEIREELELLKKVMDKRREYLDDDSLTDVIARISTLEWVLNEREDNDKISKAIREALLEELK